MQGMNAMFILEGPTWSKEDEEKWSGVGEKALLEEEEELVEVLRSFEMEEESSEVVKRSVKALSTSCLALKLAALRESSAALSMSDEKFGYRVSMMDEKQQFGISLVQI